MSSSYCLALYGERLLPAVPELTVSAWAAPALWAGGTGRIPPPHPGGDTPSLGTMPDAPSSEAAAPVLRRDSRVFSGRTKPCKKAHPLSARIPVASPLFILKTPQELIFHAISAENSHGRPSIWRSGQWGRAHLRGRAQPLLPQVACPRCAGPRPGFLLG